MFKTIEVAADCEIRSVISFLNAMFSEGPDSVHDEARNGRPSLVNDDLVRKANERVRDDRLFTISDLSLHFPQI